MRIVAIFLRLLLTIILCFWAIRFFLYSVFIQVSSRFFILGGYIIFKGFLGGYIVFSLFKVFYWRKRGDNNLKSCALLIFLTYCLYLIGGIIFYKGCCGRFSRAVLHFTTAYFINIELVFAGFILLFKAQSVVLLNFGTVSDVHLLIWLSFQWLVTATEFALLYFIFRTPSDI